MLPRRAPGILGTVRSLLLVVGAAVSCSSDRDVGRAGGAAGGQVPTEPPGPTDLLPDEPSSGWGPWKGAFQVDANGNSTYTIPLVVPPGRRGMQPPLALTYSSARGQSYLGVGWSLSGIDSVIRCGGTVAQDGATRPVRRDNLDHFCFGGQRLVEVAATSSHGGIELRTERDIFHKIVGIANSHPRSDPAWDIVRFEIWAPDGTVRRYGTQDGSRRRDGAGHTLEWLLESVTDRFGNYWSVGYDKPLAAGWDRVLGEDTEVVPRTVSYTGHDGSATSLAPESSVVFEYDQHPTPYRGFHHGVGFGVSRRLEAIKTFHQNAPVEEYRLDYTTSSLSGRSLLTSVERCDSAAVCLEPVRFEYTEGSTDYTGPTDVSDSIFFATGLPDGDNDQPRVWLHDVTGDDRADLVVLRPTGDHNAVYIAASTGSGFASPQRSSWLFPQNEEGRFFVEFSDSTHDGVDDLLYWYHTPVGSPDADWILARSSGGVFEVQSEHFAAGGAARFVDLNGDGRTDVLRCVLANSPDYHFSFTLDGATPSPGGGLPDYTCLVRDGSWSAPNRQLIDLDRDGATEVIFVAHDGSVVALDFSSNSAVASTLSVDPYALAPALPGDARRIWQYADLNGDGLRDLVTQEFGDDGGLLSSRAFPVIGRRFWGGFSGQEFPAVNLDGAAVTDVNQDGRDDFIDLEHAAQPTIYLGRDLTGFQAVLSAAGLPSLGDDESVLWGDVDGNGVADAVIFDDDVEVGTAELYLNDVPRGDLLRVVREGSATVDTVAVEYSTLTDPSVYRHDSYDCDASPPASCRRGMASAVVAAYQRHAGANLPPRRFELSYENARVDKGGRGWLGFDQVVVEDLAARTTTTTRYDLGTYDTVHRRYPFAGLPAEVETRTYLSGAENEYLDLHVTRTTYQHQVILAGPTYLAYPRTTRVRTWAIDAVYEEQLPQEKPMSDTTTTVIAIDPYGNPEHVFASSPDGHTVEVERSYDNVPATWSIGKPTAEKRTIRAPGKPPRVQKTEWTWDHTTASLELERRRVGAPGGGAPELIVDLERDPYGNVDEVIVIGANNAVRQTRLVFDDPQHMFPTSEVNALGHETHRTFHPYHGGLRRTIDPNGEASRVAFDGFGRAVRMVSADGSQVTVRHDAPFNPGKAWYRVVVKLPGQPETHVEYDLLGRRTNGVTLGFDGVPLKSGVAYDALGNLAVSWNPMVLAADENHAWSYRHDELGRLAEVTSPAGSVWRYRYGLGAGASSAAPLMGQSVTVINPNGETSTRTLDGHGRLEQVVDELGETTRYRYGAGGVLEEIEDALGNVTTMVSDDYGFQLELRDPDLGARTYWYSGFGELQSETDASGQIIEFEYDELGRRRRRIASSGETSEWVYDQGFHGVGRMSSAIGPDGHAVGYQYDAAGRLWALTRTIGGDDYRFEYGFDSDGRVETMTYPEAADGSSFAVRYEYQNGRVAAVRDAASDLVFWRRVKTDWSGRTTVARYGNGIEGNYDYTFDGLPRTAMLSGAAGVVFAMSYYHDAHSNLIGRVDHLQKMTERFDYDRIDRLVRAWFEEGEKPVEPPVPPEVDGNTQYMEPMDVEVVVPPPPPPDDPSENDGVSLVDAMALDPGLLGAARAVGAFGADPHPGDQTSYLKEIEVTYDAIGNIRHRSDVGTYEYQAPTPAGNRAHAVSRITPPGGGGPFTPARSFIYDDHGNLLSDGVRTYTYTSFDKPRTISAGKDSIHFEYDAADLRVRKEAVGSKTVYAGDLFMRRQSLGAPGAIFPEQTVDHYFIAADGRVVAEVQRNDSPFAVQPEAVEEMEKSDPDFDPSQIAGSRSTLYYHSDYVGSPEVLTDAAGLVVERRSYNAFGQLRSPDWAAGAASLPDGARPVGYTGHEDDQELGLVDMKGRLFDPAIARFTTADPLVQNPSASQSLNRYAYVFNNPLKFTDPTGYAAVPEHIQMDEQRIDVERGRTPIVPAGEPAITPAGLETAAPLAPRGMLSPDEAFGADMFLSMVPVIGSYREAKRNEQAAIDAKDLYVNGQIGLTDYWTIQALALFSAVLAAADVLTLGVASPEVKAGVLAVNGGVDATLAKLMAPMRELIERYQVRYTREARQRLMNHLASELGLADAAELAKTYSIFYHGTGGVDLDSWAPRAGGELFTSTDIAVARAFADIEALRVGQDLSQAGGVAILVPRAKIPTLKGNGMKTIGFDDGLPGTQTIFSDGKALDASADAIVPIPHDLWHFQQ